MPKTGPGKLDGFSVGIKTALNVPKKGNHLVNDQIRGNGYKLAMGADSMNVKQVFVTHEPTVPHFGNKPHHFPAGHFDASALHIQHAVNQTKMNRNGVLRHSVRPGIESRINDFLVSALCIAATFCLVAIASSLAVFPMTLRPLQLDRSPSKLLLLFTGQLHLLPPSAPRA